MKSRNEATPHSPGKSESAYTMSDLAERCRILAADIAHLQRSLETLDHGDGDSAELVDGIVLQRSTDDRGIVARSQPPSSPKGLRSRRLAGLMLIAGIAVLGGLWMWLQLGTYESTDDAQISGHVIPMSTRISGTVAHVYVENTQFVRASSPLADLDVRDYAVAVEKARADLEEAKAQLAGAHGDYQAGRAKLAESWATNLKLQQDAQRYDALLQGGVTARAQYDEAIRAARVGAAAVEWDQASVAALQKQIASREAIVEAAKASLDQALLNLSYTRIVAPVSGVIGKKTIEVGQQVEPGQQFLAIVPLDDLWVTANFKETQLRRIRLGQRVSIHVDALGRNYRGHVEGLAGASGELYSILPPENATGNYIKVVQRFPLRIDFDASQDPDHLLRPGMSVEPTVWLNESSRSSR